VGRLRIYPKELLEKYKAEEIIVTIEESGTMGRGWTGKIIAVEDDYIEFKGFPPLKLLNVSFRIRPLKKKDADKHLKKVWDDAQTFQIPFSNIARVSKSMFFD